MSDRKEPTTIPLKRVLCDRCHGYGDILTRDQFKTTVCPKCGGAGYNHVIEERHDERRHGKV